MNRNEMFHHEPQARASTFFRKVMDKPLLYTSNRSRIHGLGLLSASCE